MKGPKGGETSAWAVYFPNLNLYGQFHVSSTCLLKQQLFFLGLADFLPCKLYRGYTLLVSLFLRTCPVLVLRRIPPALK